MFHTAARLAGLMRVREMIEEKKQSDSEKYHESHFHTRFLIHLRNEV